MSESKLLGLPKRFLTVLSGQLLSLVGTQLTGFCLGVVILRETGSVTQFSLFSAAVLMPAFLLAPLVGPLADRYSKKKLLIISHALSGLSSLGLAWLFMSGQFTFELGITLVAMSSAASSIQFPTFNSAIAVMVDKEDLGRASGLSQFGYGAAQLIAPPLGGVLLPIIDISGIILCDVLSFTSAIVLLSFTSIPVPAAILNKRRAGKNNRYFSDLKFATTYMLSRLGLFGNLVLQGFMNLGIGIVMVSVTPLVLSIASERELGFILSGSGFGILLGGLCMTLMRAPKKLVRTIGLALTLQGVAYLSMCLAPTVPVLLFTGLLGGFTLPIVYTCSDLLWQHKVQPSIQGKVFGLRPLISALPYPVGFLACGPLVDDVLRPWLSGAPDTHSLRILLPVSGDQASAAAIGLCGVLLLLCIALLHAFNPIRNVEHDLKDHVSLFGQVLIKLNFASQEDIDDALWWQQAHRRTFGSKPPIGQLLVARSVISPAELKMAESTIGIPSDNDSPSGIATLDHQGLASRFEGVSSTDLPDSHFDDQGLALLGPILVELDYCDVNDLMRMYQYQHFQASSGQKRYLGELMLSEKLITSKQLERALVVLHERKKGLS